MGLSSAMGKIVGLTNKIVGATNPTALGANISSNSFMRVMGISGDLSFNSLADIKNSISEIKGGIAQGINMAVCSWEMITNPGQILDFLDQLATGMAGAIGDMLDQIFDAVAMQISMAVQQVVGAVISLISAFQNMWQSIVLLAEAIIDTVKSWFDWSNSKFSLDLQKENCKDMFAAIAGCMLNKFLGPYLEDFTSKIVGKINEVGNNFNEHLYDGLKDVNTFSSYANQEAFLLKKASIQIKGFSKESLLGD